MQLHYQVQGEGKPILLLHGLFGSLDNLGILVRHLRNDHQTIAIDLRNHGLSPWSDDMDYTLMANDIITLINELKLSDVTIIGHSMGGKTAMKLADLAPDLIKQLFIIDIAPVPYSPDSHNDVFTGLEQVINQQSTDRQSISAVLRQYLTEPVVQFLLKSFKQERWLFNFAAIRQNYPKLADWKMIAPNHKPTYFIKGGDSDYIKDSAHENIKHQFPQSKIFTVEGAGHNVHAEKPQQVLAIIDHYL